MAALLLGDETGLLKHVLAASVLATSNAQDRAAGVAVLAASPFTPGSVLAGLENGGVLRWSNDGAVETVKEAEGARIRGVCELDDGGRWMSCNEKGRLIVQSASNGELLCDMGVGNHVEFCKVLGAQAAVGGKESDLKIWDLNSFETVFTAKNVPKDALDVQVPVWNTSVCWLTPQTLCTGTAYNRVRFYDTRTQRRPVHDWSLEVVARGKTGILAANRHVTALQHGGNGIIVAADSMGDVRKIDVATGLSPGTFKGATGSVRCVDVRDGIVATCGLDRYLRIYAWDSCKLDHQLYCKQRLTAVVILSANSQGAVAGEQDDDDDVWFRDDEHDEKSAGVPITKKQKR